MYTIEGQYPSHIDTYKVNYVLHFAGLLLMIVGYYFAWRLLFKRNLDKLEESHIGYKICFYVISYLNTGLFLAVYALFLNIRFKNFDRVSPDWITECIFAPFAFMIIFTTVDRILSRKKNIIDS